jgi:hypothetical protein
MFKNQGTYGGLGLTIELVYAEVEDSMRNSAYQNNMKIQSSAHPQHRSSHRWPLWLCRADGGAAAVVAATATAATATAAASTPAETKTAATATRAASAAPGCQAKP